ncbi:MAG: NifU family protein [Ignavibacteriales bacterium]|nr:NifU family protein [Ignavibacteriales bacterium]
MFRIEDVDLTPNPQALKFVLNERLLKYDARQFNSAEESKNDPLASQIFEIWGVVSVFYTGRIITIEKTPEADWEEIRKGLSAILTNFDKSQIPSEKISKPLQNETEIFKQITEVINTRVKPALERDGGGLEIIEFKNNVLKIRYQGACGSCPSAIRGTLVAIENLLRKDVNPDIVVISA